MLITIIIPIHNSENTIEKCCNSILNSTFKDFELLLIDDYSTDNSRNIINSFNSDKRVHIFTTDGMSGGVSCARNIGIENAKGQYITFVDADDYIDNRIYEKAANIIKCSSPDLLSFNFYYNINGDISRNPSNSVVKDKLLDRNYLEENIIPVLVNISSDQKFFIGNYVWNKLFSSKIIKSKKIRFNVNRKKWEDRIFLVDFMQYIKTYLSMSNYGYYYCTSNNHLSKVNDPNVVFYILDAYKKYNTIYGNKYNFRSEFCINFYVNLLIEHLSKTLYHPINKKNINRWDLYLNQEDNYNSIIPPISYKDLKKKDGKTLIINILTNTNEFQKLISYYNPSNIILSYFKYFALKKDNNKLLHLINTRNFFLLISDTLLNCTIFIKKLMSLFYYYIILLVKKMKYLFNI